MKLRNALIGRSVKTIGHLITIIDHRLKDNYKYDPVIVDLVEDWEAGEVIDYPKEYKRISEEFCIYCSPNCDLVGVHEGLHSWNAVPFKATHYRTAPDEYIAKYVVSRGTSDFVANSVVYHTLDELGREERSGNSLTPGYSVYEYDYHKRRYFKILDDCYMRATKRFEGDALCIYVENRSKATLAMI